MDVGRRTINKAVFMWAVVALLLLIMATPALSTIFAAPGSVNTRAIVNRAVKAKKIANGAVNSAKIKDGAVNSAKIADGSIGNSDIAAGAAIAESKISRQPRTGYLVLTGADFFPLSGVEARAGSGGDVWGTGSGDVTLYSTAHLPHGATVTGFRFVGYDDSAWNAQANLNRYISTTMVMMASVTSGGSGAFSLIDNSINMPLIDNYNYSYIVYVWLRGSESTNLKANKVVITYTYMP